MMTKSYVVANNEFKDARDNISDDVHSSSSSSYSSSSSSSSSSDSNLNDSDQINCNCQSVSYNAILSILSFVIRKISIMIIVTIDAIIFLKENYLLTFQIKNSIDLATAHDFCVEILDKDYGLDYILPLCFVAWQLLLEPCK